MAFGLIPLAGLALAGIGRLINRRRQAQAGAAFGSAINTQPQGPATNTVTQAATSDPTTQTTIKGRTFGEVREADTAMMEDRSRRRKGTQTGQTGRTPQGRSGKFTMAPSGQSGQGGSPSNETRDQFVTRHFGADALVSGRFGQTSGGQGQPAGQTPATPATSGSPTSPTSSQTAAPDTGLAARLGKESVTRSRRRNKEQQAALSGAALS